MSKSKNPYPKRFTATYHAYGTILPLEGIYNNGWYQIYRILESGSRVLYFAPLRWYDLERYINNGMIVIDSSAVGQPAEEIDLSYLLELI